MRKRSLPLVAAFVFLGAGALVACAHHTDDGSDASGSDLSSAPTTPPQDPPIGSPDRTAFMAAVHGTLDPFLHNQANEYVVLWLKSKNGFTVLQAEVRGKNGAALDWKNTDFAGRVDSGEFKQADGSTKVTFSASAQKKGSAFGVLDFVVAPVGGLVAGSCGATNVPDDIFPAGPRNCTAGNGDGDGEGDGDGDGDGAADAGAH